MCYKEEQQKENAGDILPPLMQSIGGGSMSLQRQQHLKNIRNINEKRKAPINP